MTKVRLEVNIFSTRQLARVWRICRAGLEEVGALLLLMSLEGDHLLVQLVLIILFIVIWIFWSCGLKKFGPKIFFMDFLAELDNFT